MLSSTISTKLLTASSLSPFVRLLRKGRANINDVGSGGVTAVMVAAKKADKSMVKLLLKDAGYNPTMRDANGNNVFHHITLKGGKLARRAAIVLMLLKPDGADRMLRVPNARGVAPLKELLVMSRLACNVAEGSKERARTAELKELMEAHDTAAGGTLPTAEENESAAWNTKMASAFADDAAEFEPGWGSRGADDSYYRDYEEMLGGGGGGGGGGSGGGAGPPDEYAETDDDYRRRITREMNKRSRDRLEADDERVGRETKRGAFAGPARPSASASAAAAAQEAAAARARSAQIIAEQLARTEALRTKRLAEASAAYRAAVTTFFAPAAAAATGLKYADIPWPGITGDADGSDAGDGSSSKDDAVAVALHGIVDEAARKKAIRKEQVRWHPDKWTGQIKKRVAPEDYDRIMARVTEISKAFNALAA